MSGKLGMKNYKLRKKSDEFGFQKIGLGIQNLEVPAWGLDRVG
jgi:hypothetical protein